jgi:hypothetical protein
MSYADPAAEAAVIAANGILPWSGVCLAAHRRLPILPAALPKNARFGDLHLDTPLQRQACRQHHNTGPCTAVPAPGSKR